jgi:hypothetical protein
MSSPTGNVVQEAAPGSKVLAGPSQSTAADQAPALEPSATGASLLELGIALGIGLASLAVAVWVVVTGWIAYLDGIALALICLVMAVFFLFNVAWSWRQGELQALLKAWRKGSS